MLNLDPHTFGRTKACEIVVEMLNRHGDAALVSSVSRVLTTYFASLRDMMRLTKSTRILAMNMLYTHTEAVAREILTERMEAANIPFSYVNNILQHKLRQAKEHSAIIERFNQGEVDEEVRDYKAVLDKLVDMERQKDYSFFNGDTGED